MYRQPFISSAQLNLNAAYKNFFRNPSFGFPKYKSRHHDKKSYTTNNQKGTIRIVDDKTIRLPKLKDVRIKLHRKIPENALIKSATISETATRKFYISIMIEYENDIKPVELIVLFYSIANYNNKHKMLSGVLHYNSAFILINFPHASGNGINHYPLHEFIHHVFHNI